MGEKVQKSDEDWKKVLTEEEFEVLRKKGTDPPYTGKYVDNKRKGRYFCAGCGNELFSSDTKFDSGSGWPSFWAPLEEENLETKPDLSHGMERIEIVCRKCGGHLGHVFDDGPKPTGQRFCINSTALRFEEKEEGTEE